MELLEEEFENFFIESVILGKRPGPRDIRRPENKHVEKFHWENHILFGRRGQQHSWFYSWN